MKITLFTIALGLMILTTFACQDDDTTPTMANFEVSGEQVWAKCPVEFINTSLGATSYLWDFGDGNTATEENPTHHYTSPGTYAVSLTASWSATQDVFTQTVEVNQNITFEYHSYASDYACKSISTTSGEGYVMGGGTSGQTGSSRDVYLMKTDANGNTQWENTFGGSADDIANVVLSAPDGAYVLTGYKTDSGTGNKDAYLIKTDANGNLQWEKTFGSSSNDLANAMAVTPDGGYVLAGSTDRDGTNDVYLIKTDANGNLQWEKTFGGTGADWASAILCTSDGGYVLAGSTYGEDAASGDIYLIKTDANGNTQWEKTLGGGDSDWANAIISAPDGGYVLAGGTRSRGAGSNDVYLIKTDANGNMLWEKTFGGSDSDWANDITPTSDGGYVLAGYTYGQGAGSSDAYLIKTNANGNAQWEKTFGGNGYDEAEAIQATDDCGYIAVGSYDGDGFYLIKTDADGDLN